jgi:hypothetical protein
MYEKLYQYLVENNGIEKTIANDNEITLFFTPEKTRTLNGQVLFQTANETSKELKLNYFNNRIQIILNKRHFKDRREYLVILSNYLDRLFN